MSAALTDFSYERLFLSGQIPVVRPNSWKYEMRAEQACGCTKTTDETKEGLFKITPLQNKAIFEKFVFFGNR